MVKIQKNKKGRVAMKKILALFITLFISQQMFAYPPVTITNHTDLNGYALVNYLTMFGICANRDVFQIKAHQTTQAPEGRGECLIESIFIVPQDRSQWNKFAYTRYFSSGTGFSEFHLRYNPETDQYSLTHK